ADVAALEERILVRMAAAAPRRFHGSYTYWRFKFPASAIVLCRRRSDSRRVDPFGRLQIDRCRVWEPRGQFFMRRLCGCCRASSLDPQFSIDRAASNESCD